MTKETKQSTEPSLIFPRVRSRNTFEETVEALVEIFSDADY